ncbi:hypothetical protein KIPB_016549, partial [Kipferlia bialata]
DYIIDDVETFVSSSVESLIAVNIHTPVAMGADTACEGAGVCVFDTEEVYVPCGDVTSVQFGDHPAGNKAGLTATYTGTYETETRTSTVYLTCPKADAPSLSPGDSGMCYRAEAEIEGWVSGSCDTSSPCQCGVEGETHYVLEYTTQ